MSIFTLPYFFHIKIKCNIHEHSESALNEKMFIYMQLCVYLKYQLVDHLSHLYFIIETDSLVFDAIYFVLNRFFITCVSSSLSDPDCRLRGNLLSLSPTPPAVLRWRWLTCHCPHQPRRSPTSPAASPRPKTSSLSSASKVFLKTECCVYYPS